MLRFKGEDGTGLDLCSEWRGTMTAWWRWRGSLKEKGKWDDQRSHEEGLCKRNADRRGVPHELRLGGRGTALNGADWRARVAAFCASWCTEN